MSLRPGMVEVIAALRRTTGAAAGSLDDDTLQALCDARAQVSTTELLTAVRWDDDSVDWAWAERVVERTPALFVVYAAHAFDSPLAVADEAFDFERAELTLPDTVQSRTGAVYMTYPYFPLPLIAVDVWRTLAAEAATTAVDIKTDNHDIKRSQTVAHYLKLAQNAQSIAGGDDGQTAKVRRLVRSDAPDDFPG
jgi:hypothetical protein